jgi:hypothetical protein
MMSSSNPGTLDEQGSAMNHGRVSRREFVTGAAGLLLARPTLPRQRGSVTAQQIVDRIRANVGVPWRSTTVDGVKAGDPATVVSGVATTTLPTLDALRHAAAARQNLIVAQEPIFYSANDDPGNRATDPVYLAKKAFIDQQRLVVFRFTDHWAARQPSDSAKALAETLGWSGKAVAGADQTYEVPQTTLGALTADIGRRLRMRGGLRVVGQPGMSVRTVFVSPGTTTVPLTLSAFRRADVVLAGEPREWEAVPYTLDTWAARSGKGMILLGRVISESPGMQACAVWIRSLVPEVPVNNIESTDPYWNPAP